MRDKQRERVTAVLEPMLGSSESIVATAQAIINSVPADDGRLHAGARKLNKAINARAAARAEGFVAVTDQQVLCLGKNQAMRPTSDVIARIDRSAIERVDYKRGVTSTLTVWPVDGSDGLEFTFGLILRSSADGLAKILGATT